VVDVEDFWPFRGTVVWLTPQEGGRAAGPPLPSAERPYAAPAFVPPQTMDDLWGTFVLRQSERGAWSSSAEGRWLVPEEAARHRSVETGDTVLLTEGQQVVARFHVEQVRPHVIPQPSADGSRSDRAGGLFDRWRRRPTTASPTPRPYKIQLAPDVALVVYDWLEQRADEDWAGLPISHGAEIGALLKLAGALESTLVEPFRSDYRALLAAARARLADETGFTDT
jgi:hypothetical protein